MGMNLIQTGRFNRLFQKFFSIKGGANVTEVGAEILPIIPIRIGVDVRYLEGWERFAADFTQPAVAANLSGVRFRNPVGSRFVAVFEKFVAISLVTDQPILSWAAGPVTVDLATAVTLSVNALDPRTRPNPSLIASRQATAATVPAIGTDVSEVVYGAAGGSQDFILFEDQEISLMPGSAVQLRSNVVNTALAVGAIWRERALEESELF